MLDGTMTSHTTRLAVIQLLPDEPSPPVLPPLLPPLLTVP
jgi:hypothetical protein